MKSLHFLIFFFLFCSHSFAQQNHFIYIQTENKQPFYVRLGDRLLSSSSVGYIVIPKLQDGKYELNIGFPKNEWPQQKISVTVNDNDAGFVLKNFDSKGWGLFNMQTMDIVMSTGNPVNKDSDGTTRSDGFADVLADVVNTPSIKQKQATKEAVEVNVVVDSKPAPAQDNKASTSVTKEEKVIGGIVKPAVQIFSSIDNSGRSIVYIDTYENKMDTVRVFIPYNIAEKEVVTQSAEKIKTDDPKPMSKEEPVKIKETKEQPAADKKSLDIELPNPNVKVDSVINEPVKDKVEAPVTKKEPVVTNTTNTMINSDCKAIASDDDFLKLRKKMAAQKTEENMIVMAKKGFATRCFSTGQINNLSSLFLKDQGRYDFFDAAYPHVSDSQNFGSLLNRLSDEYYINRFKAMIRH